MLKFILIQQAIYIVFIYYVLNVYYIKADKDSTDADDIEDVSDLTKTVPVDDGNSEENEYTASIDLSMCIIRIGPGDTDVINLKPLASRDGFPRYNATFDVLVQDLWTTWSYTYNLCVPYSLPHSNPHDRHVFGDGCHSVVMCKYTNDSTRQYYYSLGINSQDKVNPEIVDADNEMPNVKVVLVYSGIKSQRASQVRIWLVCDEAREDRNDGLFNITHDNGRNLVLAELHHRCCCPGACWKKGLGADDIFETDNTTNRDGETMLVVAGFLVGLVMLIALVGGLCYVKRTHLQLYSKLPGISPTSRGANSSALATPLNGSKYTDFRDYEPASVTSAKRKLIPVLNDSNIQLQSVEMGQRLGGGIFGDTHLAKWNEMTVTLKRLTIAIHGKQLPSETMEWMKQEVWFLSRQRHRNIVCIIGQCLDGRLPFLLTEYVIGECLKDFLKVNGRLLTWPQRVRLCSQVADGVAFLHSTKPPIIHRDLRCGNLFLSDNDFVKVADFGLIKLLQPLRELCQNDECSCQRQLSACPAKVRWTAPEILTHPCAKEGETSIISTACDVYSFGMVMWELVVCKDPFDEISSEAEVTEIVRNGGRPDVPPYVNMMPQFKDLMKSCWDQHPDQRPQIKQVAARLKDLVAPARSHQRHINSFKQRIQKPVLQHVAAV